MLHCFTCCLSLGVRTYRSIVRVCRVRMRRTRTMSRYSCDTCANECQRFSVLPLTVTDFLNPVRPMHSHPRLPLIEIVMQIDSLEMRVPVMPNLPLHHEVASGPARTFTNHDLFHLWVRLLKRRSEPLRAQRPQLRIRFRCRHTRIPKLRNQIERRLMQIHNRRFDAPRTCPQVKFRNIRPIVILARWNVEPPPQTR